MNYLNNKFFGIICFGAMLLCQACKKDKTDFKPDNRMVTENRLNSSVRIINLAEFNQVIANGDSLTNFLVLNPNTPTGYQYPGTAYFPVNGQLGKSWHVPQDLFNTQDSANLTFVAKAFQQPILNDVNLDVKNDFTSPKDYYLMPTSFMDGQPEIVSVDRGISEASKPDHFKIRIVNLSGAIKNRATNANGSLEDLAGNVSLAYADGTLVNPETNNVSSAKIASEYIELPYGTYQFKVLLPDGRQIPAIGKELHNFTLLDPPTSTIPRDLMNSTGLTYAPIQTYQPGGIYTIVIAPQQFNYLINENGEEAATYQNSFQVINDNSTPANNTYFKVQAVNAWTAQNVGIRVNGKSIASNLAFGATSDYSSRIVGNHTVEAVDANGTVLATASQSFRPTQNYTVWIYPDQAGTAKLIIVSNDLSGATFKGSPQEDATFARNQYHYFFFKRFLNLSVDNPYITFTLSNGQTAASLNDNANAGVNLQPGMPVFEGPYLSSPHLQSPFQIMAYRSKPNVVPGLWADDIEVLSNDAFIANEALYQSVGRNLPVQEPGVYTIGLIGRSGAASTPENKARMIIIKHNK